MPLYPSDFLDQIKRSVPLSRWVGKRVRLRRQGKEWVGLSPFKPERTPSFYVNDDKRFFYCFSSQRSGDIFQWLIDQEGHSFDEAVRILAEEAGLPLPVREPTTGPRAEQKQRKTKRREAAYQALEATAQYFTSELFLRSPEALRGREFLKQRGITASAAKRFRVGLASSDSNRFLAFLLKAHIEPALAIELGLLRQSSSHQRQVPRNDSRDSDASNDSGGSMARESSRDHYAFFRDRIMFPILDRRGRVIAFGGRYLGTSPRVGKYINSPDQELFHKSATLYGPPDLHAITRKAGRMILVEGYLDVMAMVQVDIEETAAPLGTAVTEQHLRQAFSCAQEVILCLDGDSAGRQAAERTVMRLLPLLNGEREYHVRIAFLPDGEDPDSWVRAGGPDSMNRLLARAMGLSDFLWLSQARRANLRSAEGRATLERALTAQVDTIPDRVLRFHLIREFRNRIWEAGKAAFSSPRTRSKIASSALDLPRRFAPPSVSRVPRMSQTLDALGAQDSWDTGDIARFKRRPQEGLASILLHHPEWIGDYAERIVQLDLPPDLDKFLETLQIFAFEAEPTDPLAETSKEGMGGDGIHENEIDLGESARICSLGIVPTNLSKDPKAKVQENLQKRQQHQREQLRKQLTRAGHDPLLRRLEDRRLFQLFPGAHPSAPSGLAHDNLEELFEKVTQHQMAQEIEELARGDGLDTLPTAPIDPLGKSSDDSLDQESNPAQGTTQKINQRPARGMVEETGGGIDKKANGEIGRRAGWDTGLEADWNSGETLSQAAVEAKDAPPSQKTRDLHAHPGEAPPIAPSDSSKIQRMLKLRQAFERWGNHDVEQDDNLEVDVEPREK